jgi:2-aminoadipate transaminase
MEATDLRRAWAPRFTRRAAGIQGSVIDSSTSLLQRQTHDVIPFAMGSPAPDAIPTEAFEELGRAVLHAGGAGAFGYGPTEGERALRSALLDSLATEGEEVEPDRLLITAGGMQGLDLVCKLFVDAGDLVVAESPTYTNGTATIASYEGNVLEVPVDDDGMEVDALPELVRADGRTPRMIYTIPNYQNPSGTTLSLPRRVRLLELAEEWDAVVLEDDPYRMLHFEGPPPASLRALSGDAARVIAVHTFSKTVAPGLRVGWIVAHAPIVERMIAAKQGMDTCTNVFSQRLVAEFIVRGLLDAHVERLRRSYREKKVAMQSALGRFFGDVEGVSWTDPAGGLFLWLSLPPGSDSTALFPVALEEGVAFIPGSAFSVGGAFRDALRLCFSYPDEERIVEGVRRLRVAFDRTT